MRKGVVSNARYKYGAYVKYSLMGDDPAAMTQTPVVKSTTPKFSHHRIVTFSSITEEHLEFFHSNCITFFLYGVQQDDIPDKRLAKMNTKVRKFRAVLSIRLARLKPRGPRANRGPRRPPLKKIIVDN